jgi:glycosyltransferase involved in cell wall biosynthesis
MEKKPFFTILTASYNNGATIKKTLESVSVQSFQDVEHIVIDGGSSDNTLNVLKMYEKKYNLKWISEPDEGIADAMNKGLKLSKGKFIIFIHADDRLYNNKILTNVYNDIKKYHCDIYSYHIEQVISVQVKKIGKSKRVIWWHRFRNNIRHQGTFVNEGVFREIGLFNTNYSISMDYDFFYRALNADMSVKFINKVSSTMGHSGISSNKKMDFLRIKEDFAIQKENENNIIWIILQIIFRFFYYPYKIKLLPKIRHASR